MPSLRLTKQSVAAITVPPGKGDILVFDTELAGFGVKASRGGGRSYIVQYRPIGQRIPKRLTIGRVDTLAVDEARRLARTLLAKAQTGNDPHAEKATAKAQAVLTLGSVADRYLAHVETRQRPGTHYQTKLHLTKHWAPLRPLPLHKVRRADVAARLGELAKSSGGVSANRSRAALSAMFTWAIGEGLVESNPVAGTNKPAEEKSRERVLSDLELATVWKTCGDDSHGRIVKLLLLTGQRRNEVGQMLEEELDLDAATWTIPSSRAKNHRAHVVPLSAAALTILRDAPRVVDRDPVFGEGKEGFSGWSRSKARLDDAIKAVLTKQAKEAGRDPEQAAMAPWTLHDLRRTATTGMVRIGVMPHVAEAVTNHISGHRSGVAGVYNRADYAMEKRDALDRWANHIELAVGL